MKKSIVIDLSADEIKQSIIDHIEKDGYDISDEDIEFKYDGDLIDDYLLECKITIPVEEVTDDEKENHN